MKKDRVVKLLRKKADIILSDLLQAAKLRKRPR